MFLVVIYLSISFSVSAEISPYVNKKNQLIKTLTEERIQQFLNGDGMGFALSAELNGYPGPKHVIELKDKLSLTETQLEKTRHLFSVMKNEAKTLGESLVNQEKQLEELFRSGEVSARKIHRPLLTT